MNEKPKIPEIPDFLKRSNNKKPLSEFKQLLIEYKKIFNDLPPTEPGGEYTEDEWCSVLEECIKKNKTYRELTEFEYEDDFDY